MGVLSREVEITQNAALGASLLWSFADEHVAISATHAGPPFHAVFSVLPLVLHEDTRTLILSTQRGSSLRSFAEKFSQSKIGKSDLLVAIQARMTSFRALTVESFRVLLSCGMATVDAKDGTVLPTRPRGLKTQLSEDKEHLVRAARYLGGWMSSLSLYEIAVTLRLYF